MSIYTSTSVAAHNSTTTPAAGATLASLSVAPGWYEVFCGAYLSSGTPGSADTDNVQLTVDGNVVAVLLVPGTVNSMLPAWKFVVNVGTSTIALKAVALSNGTSVVYKSLVSAQLVPLAAYR